MIETNKAGKHYRISEKRTASEKPQKCHTVLIKAEDSKQSERLQRKILGWPEEIESLKQQLKEALKLLGDARN